MSSLGNTFLNAIAKLLLSSDTQRKIAKFIKDEDPNAAVNIAELKKYLRSTVKELDFICKQRPKSPMCQGKFRDPDTGKRVYKGKFAVRAKVEREVADAYSAVVQWMDTMRRNGDSPNSNRMLKSFYRKYVIALRALQRFEKINGPRNEEIEGYSVLTPEMRVLDLR